jgi:hypothetical protein
VDCNGHETARTRTTETADEKERLLSQLTSPIARWSSDVWRSIRASRAARGAAL